MKALNIRFTAQEQAITLASAALDKRLESMNKFREESRRDTATFVSRETFDAHVRAQIVQIELMESEITAVQRGIDKITTTVATLRALVAIVGAPGILAMIWALIAAAAHKTVAGPGGLFP
jgi:hypothetical protein